MDATPTTSSAVTGAIGTEMVTVARQPIYSRSLAVTAYELLHRTADGVQRSVGDTVATNTVLSNGLLWIGLEALAADRPAFVNFGRDLLLSEEILELPPQRIVVEVLETVAPDPEVIEALQTLHRQGFKLALDDFTWEPGREVFLPLVDVVKLDFGAIAPEDRDSAVERVRALRFAAPRILAEKVETAADFDQARRLDVDLVQGYLWGLPQLLTGLRLTPSSTSCLALIQQLHGGLGSTTAVVEGIKRDPALVQGLLRYVNSGLFRWVSPIDSIEHAVNMLGRNELLRWAALMAAQQANGSGLPANTALTAITRGRFCELTANSLDSGQDGMDYFLVGLFSLADCMFGVALPEALTYVPLSPPMLAAIAEDAGEAGLVLRAARAIERGNVGAIQESAQALGVTPDALQTSYLSAARWGADCV